MISSLSIAQRRSAIHSATLDSAERRTGLATVQPGRFMARRLALHAEARSSAGKGGAVFPGGVTQTSWPNLYWSGPQVGNGTHDAWGATSFQHPLLHRFRPSSRHTNECRRRVETR